MRGGHGMPCPYDRGITFSRRLVKGAFGTGGHELPPLPIAALIADLRPRLGPLKARLFELRWRSGLEQRGISL